MTGNDALVRAHAIDAIAAVRGYRVQVIAEAVRRGLRLVTISPSVLVPVSPGAGPVEIRLMICPAAAGMISRGGCSGGALRMSGPWPSDTAAVCLPRRRLRSARRPCADPPIRSERDCCIDRRSPKVSLIRSDLIVDLGRGEPGEECRRGGIDSHLMEAPMGPAGQEPAVSP